MRLQRAQMSRRQETTNAAESPISQAVLAKVTLEHVGDVLFILKCSASYVSSYNVTLSLTLPKVSGSCFVAFAFGSK